MTGWEVLRRWMLAEREEGCDWVMEDEPDPNKAFRSWSREHVVT